MLLKGIQYSIYTALPFFTACAIALYFMVAADPYKTDSSGVAYYVYSIPLQILLLLIWGKHKTYNAKQLAFLTIIFCIVAFITHVVLWFVYFGVGGRP